MIYRNYIIPQDCEYYTDIITFILASSCEFYGEVEVFEQKDGFYLFTIKFENKSCANSFKKCLNKLNDEVEEFTI